MGILDDTLLDAARPLPEFTLHRESDGSDPEFSSEPPADDDGAALTVFRLQKDGGNSPPAVPGTPRAVDAGAPRARPLHAPAGDFLDASLQFVTSIDGLETGKGPVRTRNSDATDRQERLDSPDSSHRLHFVDSTGSRVFSSQAPSPFDDPGKLVQRIDSSDGMRRETGRGAPSGDPSPQAAGQAPQAATTTPEERATAIPATPVESATAALVTRPEAGITAPRPATLGEALSAAASRTIAAHVEAHAIEPSSRAGNARPAEMPGTVSTPRPAAAAAPHLSIGRIEVTVLSAPQPRSRATTPASSDAFLSKHYLRRL